MSLLFRDKPLKGECIRGYAAGLVEPYAIATIANEDPEIPERYVYVEYSDRPDEVKEFRSGPGETVIWHPYVQDRQRTAIYISGVSGSGKSVWASNAIKELRSMTRFKKHPVWFISLKDANDPAHADPAFVGIRGFTPIDVYRPGFMEIDYTAFEKSIVIFDDYNQLPNKDPLYIHIMTLQKKLLELSRKMNTMLIIINHQTMDYNRTRDIIFECDTAVCFPRSNLRSTTKFVSAYLSDDKNLVQDINNIKGDQFTALVMHKTSPQYLMTNKWIRLF